MLACPRCQFAYDVAAACPRCGVVFAKVGVRHVPAGEAREPFVLPRFRVRSSSLAVTLAALAMATYLAHIGYAPIHLRPWDGVAHTQAVDTSSEPEQIDIPPAERRPLTWRARGARVVVEPMAHYRIAGRVVARDFYYLDALAAVSPEDLTLVWGPFATHRFDAWVTYGHFARFGSYRYSDSSHIDVPSLARHLSNNHLIPANDHVRAALASVKIDDEVELEGDLVDLSLADGTQARTSLTRDDTGAGACEVIYVRRVKIGRMMFW